MHVSSMTRASAGLLLLVSIPRTSVTAQETGATARAQTLQDQTLTLSAAISRALATHPSVGAAAEAVRAARGSRLTARSWTNPTFNYQSEGANGSTPAGPPPAIDREVMAFGTLQLEPIYQLWPRASQASAEVRAAEADLAGARRMIVLDAAGAFFASASAQVSIDALLDVRGWLDSLVGYTRVRVREGAAAEVDLIRLEVEHGRAQTDLAMARVDLARARAQLATFIGTDSVTLAIAIDTATNIATLPRREDLLVLAQTRRPEMHAANARLDAARSGVSVERSRIVREVGLIAGVKTMAGGSSLVTGFSIPVPLFDQNRGEIQRAGAQRRIAAFQREQVERQVAADVNATYAAVQTLTEQVELMRGDLLRRAEEGRRIAEAAYREGATSLVQVLDAARALAEARQVYYRALFARRQSLLELNAAIGASDVSALLSVPTGNQP